MSMLCLHWVRMGAVRVGENGAPMGVLRVRGSREYLGVCTEYLHVGVAGCPFGIKWWQRNMAGEVVTQAREKVETTWRQGACKCLTNVESRFAGMQ